MADEILIGDLVVPASEPMRIPMTVYDFAHGYSTALCNWLVGTEMHKAPYPVRCLIRLTRSKPADRRAR